MIDKIVTIFWSLNCILDILLDILLDTWNSVTLVLVKIVPNFQAFLHVSFEKQSLVSF